MIESLSIANSSGFGLEIIDGGEMKITEDAELTLTGNILGAQISVGSTLFAVTGSKIIADNNILIGFSVNTGSSVFIFNADISASGNGLDGLDIISSANMDVDGNSTLTVNNNRREGISLDDGSLNLFGFFSTQENLPRLVANNNANNGIQIEFASKLDIGRNATIEVLNNGKAGIYLDDGSNANIHDSVITGNNGILVEMDDDDNSDDGRDSNDDGNSSESPSPADVIATFGSRVSFQKNNTVGLALCDKSSMVRGDVKCEH